MDNDKLESIINDLRLNREQLLDKISTMQSNWNSLRKWLENNFNVFADGIEFKKYIELQKVLDKMNELEKRR